MPDETGLRGLLMSARSAFNMPKKGKDVNLEDPKKKKKGFMDRFIDPGSKADDMRKGAEMLRGVIQSSKKK